MKAAVARPDAQTALDRLIGKLGNLSAGIADGKCHQAVPMVMRVRAGDKGVQALQPVHHAELLQLLQRTINLKRRAKTVVPQLVQQASRR